MLRNINGWVMSKNRKVAEVKNGALKPINHDLMPLMLQNQSDFESWLEERAIDTHRTNSRLLKKVLRMTESTDAELVLSVNAATITDTYWFLPAGKDLNYEDVRFESNDFDTLALYGDPDSFAKAPSPTPELTNIGSYEKCWRRVGDRWYLYKNGTELELFSEMFVFLLGRSFGFTMAEYELADGFIRTPDFTDSASVNFETAFSFMGQNEEYPDNFKTFLKFGEDIAASYIAIIYLDTLCNNMDRHTRNYGVLRDVETGAILKMAPNFDNNVALISRGHPQNVVTEQNLLIKLFVDFINSTPEAKGLFKYLRREVKKDYLLLICDKIGIKDIRVDLVADMVMQRAELLDRLIK